jgi:hypothetical protein
MIKLRQFLTHKSDMAYSLSYLHFSAAHYMWHIESRRRITGLASLNTFEFGIKCDHQLSNRFNT